MHPHLHHYPLRISVSKGQSDPKIIILLIKALYQICTMTTSICLSFIFLGLSYLPNVFCLIAENFEASSSVELGVTIN